MEDYKKKYERALYNLKIIKAHNKDNKELVAFIDHEYPELKESEDEKIRKYIVNHFQGHLDTCKRFTRDGMFPPFSASEIEMLEASIAWLEKQGEQKPAWSEEDEGMCIFTIKILNDIHYKDNANWLKSLKERMKGE